MTASPLLKAGILTLILVTTSLVSWEFYVRSKGFDASYDDGGPLWADKRAMVYEPADKATVFIGSSRIKFDLDINTWQNITGDHAIQLACVGSTPFPQLQDLADDSNFKGKLIIDVTEILFFSTSPFYAKTPGENIKYYKSRTPAQRASFVLDHGLESHLVFLDKDRLSLNAELASLHIPNRPGVFEFPLFAPGFGRVKFSRQEYMTDAFVADTNQVNEVRGVWAFLGSMPSDPPISGSKLDSVLNVVKTCVDKIRARGGQVIFTRTPSSGPFLMGENMGYPRQKYWDRLLAVTNCQGIYFADYPAIAHFQCPEFSHLKQPDAIVYTKNLIKILSEDEGWKFQKPISIIN
jgi:hypothetical protein